MTRFTRYFIALLILPLSSQEMVIGEELMAPGIKIVFEGAPKDTIFPLGSHLKENETDIHIEMLANWSANNSFNFPEGGFVAYLDVQVLIKNQNGKSTKIKLSPHINLIDSLHYAKNIKLPGSIKDTYDVSFIIDADQMADLGIHNDWHKKVGAFVTKHTFSYKNLSFESVAKAQRL